MDTYQNFIHGFPLINFAWRMVNPFWLVNSKQTKGVFVLLLKFLLVLFIQFFSLFFLRITLFLVGFVSILSSVTFYFSSSFNLSCYLLYFERILKNSFYIKDLFLCINYWSFTEKKNLIFSIISIVSYSVFLLASNHFILPVFQSVITGNMGYVFTSLFNFLLYICS